MQHSANPNSTEKLRIQPQFQRPNESMENAIDSFPRFGQNRLNSPLLSSQHKRGSLILAPSENPRAALSLDKAVEYELKYGGNFDPKMDRKKLRRIISNRQSAQKARVRKAKYINELEKRVNHLEGMISVLTSGIESYIENRKLLLLQNESFQRLLQIRLDEATLSEIELEKNRMEVFWLKELEKTQSKNIHDSNVGGQQMQDLISKHYARLGFYQNGLQKLGSMQSGSATELPLPVLTPKENQVEAEVDQYLNFED